MSQNRNTNMIKGISAGLILLLGLGMYFAFQSGLFDESFPWIIVAIFGGVVVLVLSGIMVIPRSRVNKLSRSHEIRTDKDYRVYHDRTQETEQRDFIPSKKFNKKTRDRIIFCNYCGIKLEEKTSICSNCGQKLE